MAHGTMRVLLLTAILSCLGLFAPPWGRARLPAQQPEPAKGVTVENTLAARFDAGRKWAVLIGVDKYLDPQIPGLEFCAADVRLMADTLSGKCGYEAERILVMTDDQEKDHLRPLGINLRKQIPTWLKNAQSGDTVLVFFSGHGFLDDRGQGFLAPKDCEKANLGLTGFRTDDLRDTLQQCKATQKLLILDCCHAGAEKALAVVGPSSEELGAAFAKARGLITLASCGKNELSREWRQKRQGLFTYFLTQGLAGQADFDHDGVVDSDELYRYAIDRVSTTAQRELNAQQTPVRNIPPDVVGVFALARSTGKRERPKQLTNTIGMKLILIPAGEFTMGSPLGEGYDNEHPPHRVQITKPFYLGQTEVTQRQYEAAMGRNPAAFSPGGKKSAKVAGQDTSNFPVEMVSHEDAVKFCNRLAALENLSEGSYRLPTEAEWEYAARGNAEGGGAADCDAAAWYANNAGAQPHEVAQKAPNGFGLYDTSGNVSEWCSDWLDATYYARSEPRDPTGPPAPDAKRQRVLRGGDWTSGARYCRPADRNAQDPSFPLHCSGFRVVRTADSVR